MDRQNTIKLIPALVFILIILNHVCFDNDSRKINKSIEIAQKIEEVKTKDTFDQPPEKFIIPRFTNWSNYLRAFGNKPNPPECPKYLPGGEMVKPSENSEKILMIGILTVEKNCYRRQVLRSTILNNTLFSYKFLFDRATPKIIEEQKIYNDIVILNTKFTGRANRFGEKLYKWYKYAADHFFEYKLIAKSDDDVFICPESLMNDLLEESNRINWPNLYYGWMWNQGKDKEIKKSNTDGKILKTSAPDLSIKKINHEIKMDEFFVILGQNLVSKIASKTYCLDSRLSYCQNHKKLYDTNFGGSSLGYWLNEIQSESEKSFNNSVYTVISNSKMIHYPDVVRNNGNTRSILNKMNGDNEKFNFCHNFTIFHKANSKFIRYFYQKYVFDK